MLHEAPKNCNVVVMGFGRARQSGRRRTRPRFSFFMLGLSLLGLAYALQKSNEFTKIISTYSEVRESAGVSDLSFVVAARDIEYCGYHKACGPGMRTDTIFYVKLNGSEVTMVALPRDLRYTSTVCRDGELEGFCTGTYTGKINAVYQNRGGAEGLRKAVQDVLKVPVQGYAILTLDSVQDLVDAVDGVDIVLPFPMKYTDTAAKLFIDFPAGKNHFNGEEAVKYMRFRHAEGSDLGRLDRIKELMNQVVGKAQRPQYWPNLPNVLTKSWQNLETSIDLPTMLAMLPSLKGISIKSAILPTLEDGNDLVLDESQMESLSSSLLGFESDADAFERLVEAGVSGYKVLLTDGSGKNLGLSYQKAFTDIGLIPPDIRISEDSGPSAVYVRSGVSVVSRENPTLAVARDYAELMHLPLLSKFQLEAQEYDVIIHLGEDAQVL